MEARLQMLSLFHEPDLKIEARTKIALSFKVGCSSKNFSEQRMAAAEPSPIGAHIALVNGKATT